MIKTLCDQCGKEIPARSDRPIDQAFYHLYEERRGKPRGEVETCEFYDYEFCSAACTCLFLAGQKMSGVTALVART